MESQEPGPKGGRPSLETMRGVRTALASCLSRIRTGKMNTDTGRTLIQGYKTMADLLIDERDNRYKKRLKTLWEAHQRAQGLPVDAEPVDEPLGLPAGDVQ